MHSLRNNKTVDATGRKNGQKEQVYGRFYFDIFLLKHSVFVELFALYLYPCLCKSMNENPPLLSLLLVLRATTKVVFIFFSLAFMILLAFI